MGLKKKLRAAVKPVQTTEEDKKFIEENNVERVRKDRELTSTTVAEVREAESTAKPGVEYVSLEVKGSSGKIYKIVMPKGYAKMVPKTWSWDEKRYRIAEAISAGMPITRISDAYETPRSVIYGWLQHPEFKEHVDALTLESGWANQRERIAGLSKVVRLLFDKVVDEIDHVKLTDKSIGAVLTSLQTIAKQIGQEKGEFVEQSKVENNTTLNGAVGIANVNIDNVLESKSEDERAKLKAEFDSIGDDIIRSITGDKE